MIFFKKSRLFAVFLLIQSNILLAQNNFQCQQMFDKYIAGLGEYEAPKEGKHYFVHTVVSTIPNTLSKEYSPSAYSSENINVRVVIAKGKVFYYSNYLDFYQDNKDLFTIIHPQKLIIWQKPESQREEDKQAFQLTPFRKKMLDELALVECIDVVIDKKKSKQITFSPKKQTYQRFISKVTYFFDEKVGKLEKQETIYAEGQANLRQEIIYKEFNANYTEKVADSAIENVFDSRKKLLNRFKGYTVEFK